jgi:DNA repair exonuclease SbcCD ATPase subunit
MQITRVLLNNFAQHKLVDQYLTENIVGIVGRNGSGKSNFATAISIAISGEFGKKKKKDYITFGEKTGALQIEGIINSKDFVVKRSLNLNDCSLEYDGSIVDGADAVNAKLLDMLGCDKAFLPNMVFVSQTDILGILFGRPSERNKMLQKFFGLEKAAKLELTLGQWKSNISYPAIIDEEQSRSAIENLKKIIDKNNADLNKLNEELSSIEEQIENIVPDKIRKNYELALEKENLISSLNLSVTDILKFSESIKDLIKPEVDQSDIDKLSEELDTLNSISGSLQKVIKLLDSAQDCKSSCPICNSELNEHSIENMLSRQQESRRELDSINDKIKEVQAKLKHSKRVLQSYSSNLLIYEGYINRAKNKQLEIEKTLAETPFPQFSSDRYLEGIKQIEATQSSARLLRSQINSIEENNTQLNFQILKHTKDIEAAQKVKAVFDNTKIHESRISRIRDVFRHDGVSGRYVNQRMNQMCSSINQYLQSFNAAYRVQLEDDNEFVCDFGDKIRPSSDLSCGQKVVLSLAFRFAACEIFSTGVNFIVLDEPTTWLDKETVDSFQTIIESISELSDSQNLQVLIVTHERSLMPYFRQTIEF